MKIVVIFPTSTEAQYFSHPQVQVEIGGVGLSAAAYSTTKVIARHNPDWLIMAGIAGVYEHSHFSAGDVVLVGSECESDLGFFTPGGFSHLADLDLAMDFPVSKIWRCPYVPEHSPIPLASSNSTNAAMAPFIETMNTDIENMEGAAFFRVCTEESQRFLQVRSISNVVKIGDDDWDMEASVLALTAGLHQLINFLLDAKS